MPCNKHLKTQWLKTITIYDAYEDYWERVFPVGPPSGEGKLKKHDKTGRKVSPDEMLAGDGLQLGSVESFGAPKDTSCLDSALSPFEPPLPCQSITFYH